ncbi:MAG: BON domain-containing protein [Steroidobacteraceae bacterium]
MRCSFGIVCASTIVVAVLSGCAATPSHEATGQAFDDATITSKVKADFIEDPLTKGRDISVTTKLGVVQLSGAVDSRKQRAEAVRVAKAVPGVRRVDNDLQVRPTSD